MKTRREIERELEVRIERIKLIRIFGNKREVEYERGYVDCLGWALENFSLLSKDAIVYKLLFEPSNNANQDEGCKAALRWVSEEIVLK